MFKQGDIVSDRVFGLTGVLLECYEDTNNKFRRNKLVWKMLVMHNEKKYHASVAGDIVVLGDKYLKDNYHLVVDND
jgi:hypothetical protein